MFFDGTLLLVRVVEGDWDAVVVLVDAGMLLVALGVLDVLVVVDSDVVVVGVVVVEFDPPGERVYPILVGRL